MSGSEMRWKDRTGLILPQPLVKEGLMKIKSTRAENAPKKIRLAQKYLLLSLKVGSAVKISAAYGASSKNSARRRTAAAPMSAV